jgi:hypothetical protein
MKIRTDKLSASVYARHGDSCSLAPHCESLGCASGFKPDDYVVSAKFAYLTGSVGLHLGNNEARSESAADDAAMYAVFC